MKYEKIIKLYRSRILEQEGKDDNCKPGENKPCGCVDSGTDLTIEEIQNFLAEKYGKESGKGLEVTFSGQFGRQIEGEADGVCGPETRSFIMKFQKEKKICIDACVGEVTLGEMKSDNPGFFSKDGDSSSKTKKKKVKVKLQKRPATPTDISADGTPRAINFAEPAQAIAAASLSGVTIVIKSNQPSKTPSRFLKDKSRRRL